MRRLSVKSGIRRDIDLTAKHRIDARRLRLFIEINHAEHDAVIRDRRRRHAKLLHSLYIFFDLIRTVQKTVLRMDV